LNIDDYAEYYAIINHYYAITITPLRHYLRHYIIQIHLLEYYYIDIIIIDTLLLINIITPCHYYATLLLHYIDITSHIITPLLPLLRLLRHWLLPLLITPAIIDIIDIIINIDAATPLLLILIAYITPHYIIIIDWRHITLRHIDITPLTLATLLTYITLHITPLRCRHWHYYIIDYY
jgi:hypothetical protein